MVQSYISYLTAFVLFIVLVSIPHKNLGQISTQASVGALYINGDVDPVVDVLNSFHVGISKTVKNNWNAELRLGFSKTVGLSGNYMEPAQLGGGLVEEEYAILGSNVWYPNYLATYAYADLGANYILNTGLERLRCIGGASLGVSLSSMSINLLGLENKQYNIQYPETSNIDDVKKAINRDYDSTYETQFDGDGVVPHLSLQLGIQFKITRGIYLSADVRYHITNSDYLDPIRYVSSTEDSGNKDSVSMFTLGFIGYLLPDIKEDKGPIKLETSSL